MGPIYAGCFARKYENFDINFSGKIQLADKSISLIYALPHVNPEYGDVCTPHKVDLF